MADEGPSVEPSRSPAWGSAIAMNGLGDGNTGTEEDGCLGDWAAVAAGGSATRPPAPPPCLAPPPTALLDLLCSMASRRRRVPARV